MSSDERTAEAEGEAVTEATADAPADGLLFFLEQPDRAATAPSSTTKDQRPIEPWTNMNALRASVPRTDSI